jgi:hypothetical protein
MVLKVPFKVMFVQFLHIFWEKLNKLFFSNSQFWEMADFSRLLFEIWQ